MKKGKIFFEKEKNFLEKEKITLEKLFPIATLAQRSQKLRKNEKYGRKTR
ncbi:MAG: hypothetical protein J6T94_02590 [Bacteroidaceae bacterium]|nr:hypothetical protein [Bacteroidaceae bacterium]